MTSERSIFSIALQQSVMPLAIVVILYLTPDVPKIILIFVASHLGYGVVRQTVRRSTLHKREDGVYFWIELGGETHYSITDPSDPGGAWGESDGDGGDGGGD